MTRQELLDLYFLDARARTIDLAAFLDRLDRAEGPEDFRIEALRAALAEMATPQEGRVRRVLTTLSDPTTEPLASAPGKGACGAFNPATDA
ncbi:MAG: hypothetical protein QOD99_3009 [Chthoniobacter sp.]|jgi:hypothetical protein|nr:hypothetical protein [Chthoniobacter sp.]